MKVHVLQHVPFEGAGINRVMDGLLSYVVR